MRDTYGLLKKKVAASNDPPIDVTENGILLYASIIFKGSLGSHSYNMLQENEYIIAINLKFLTCFGTVLM